MRSRHDEIRKKYGKSDWFGACSSVKTGLCKMDRQNYFFSLGGVDNYNPY